jgi:hypothetical protein
MTRRCQTSTERWGFTFTGKVTTALIGQRPGCGNRKVTSTINCTELQGIQIILFLMTHITPIETHQASVNL